MNIKYKKILESAVADLLTKYNYHLDSVNDDTFEYYTIVTAALVFKNLAIQEFKKIIERDSEEDSSDICKIMEAQAEEISNSIIQANVNSTEMIN